MTAFPAAWEAIRMDTPGEAPPAVRPVHEVLVRRYADTPPGTPCAGSVPA